MGVYLTPAGESNDSFLAKHGRIVTAEYLGSLTEEDLRKGSELPICLIEGETFTAALVVWDEVEIRRATEDDHRRRDFFMVHKSILLSPAAGLDERELPFVAFGEYGVGLEGFPRPGSGRFEP